MTCAQNKTGNVSGAGSGVMVGARLSVRPISVRVPRRKLVNSTVRRGFGVRCAWQEGSCCMVSLRLKVHSVAW